MSAAEKDTPAVGTLAVPEDAGAILSAIGKAESEWDGLDDLDLAPAANKGAVPYYKTSGKLDGGFISSETGEVTNEVVCVLASRSISRAWFAQSYDDDPEARPACFSVDGVTPSEAAPDRQADHCTGCPQSFEGGGTCRKSLELLAYLPAVGQDGAVDVMRFRFGGLSYKHARRYWDSFGTRIPSRPPISVVTKITMEKEKVQNGTFLVPHFQVVKALSRDEAEVFVADARRRKAAWQTMVAEDLAESGADEEPGPFDGPPPAAPAAKREESIPTVPYDSDEEPF